MPYVRFSRRDCREVVAVMDVTRSDCTVDDIIAVELHGEEMEVLIYGVTADGAPMPVNPLVRERVEPVWAHIGMTSYPFTCTLCKIGLGSWHEVLLHLEHRPDPRFFL